MKGYEVWGRIEEGCSEFLGLFTEFRKADAKRYVKEECYDTPSRVHTIRKE